MLTRAQWGARAPKTTPATVPLSRRTGYCVHHDGPNPLNLRTLADVIALLHRDQNYHMDGQGWNDIGYNFLVVSAPGYDAIDGLLVEGRGRDVIGAHCKDHNTEWVGTQVTVGGGQTPSKKALITVRRHYDQLVAAKGSPLGKYGHRDGFNTTCPDTKLYTWVHAGMPIDAPPTPTPPKPVPSGADRTRTATFQRMLEVGADGLWGAGTDRVANQMRTACRAWFGYPTLVRTGFDVPLVQRIIDVAPDGIFGPLSKAALKTWNVRLQGLLRVGMDGWWGPQEEAAYQTFRKANLNRF